MTEGLALSAPVPAWRRLLRFGRATLRQTPATIRHTLRKQTILQRLQIVRATLRHLLVLSGWPITNNRGDRTAYVIGLFGTGRHYVNELIAANLGKRSIYLIEGIRYHPAPTSLIYTYHATLKYTRLFQVRPELTSRLLQSVRTGFADLIFIYRHPLDSLLSNWIWMRTYIRKPSRGWGRDISMAYKNAADLSAELEQNFAEFKAFADGDAAFSAIFPGPPFLSFAEFVEETTLFIRCATLSLRLEDFMIDPLKEFSKIARVMSVDLDTNSLRLPPPRTELYRYKTVAARVPRFQAYIDALDADTRRRIEEIGYVLESSTHVT